MTSQEQELEIIAPLVAIEAEEQVLGGVILESMGGSVDAGRDLIQTLTAGAFWAESNKLVYQAIASCVKQSIAPDLIAVTGALADCGHLDMVGGKARITRLLDGALGFGVWRSSLQILRRKYAARQLHEAGDTLKAIALQTSLDTQELQRRAQQTIDRPFTGLNTGVTFSENSGAIASRVLDLLDRRLNGEVSSLESGFYDLDEILGGFSNPRSGDEGRLIIIGARPSIGKSAIALQLALKLARNCQVGAIVFSLEMSSEQMASRMLSLWSGVASTDLRRPTGLTPGDVVKLRSAATEIAKIPLEICDRPNLSIDALRREVVGASRRFAEQGQPLGLVVLDYLQLMDGTGLDGNEQRRMGIEQVTRQLKLLSKELRCDVVVLSQLSRSVETRQNKRPQMSDLRETGAIEQDADAILLLYRDEYYNPDTPDRGICEVIVAKQRSGPCGTVRLLFEPQFTRFRNLASARPTMQTV